MLFNSKNFKLSFQLPKYEKIIIFNEQSERILKKTILNNKNFSVVYKKEVYIYKF